MADYPGESHWNGVGFSLAGRGYLVGGVSSIDYVSWDDMVYEYNPILDQWESTGSHPDFSYLNSSGNNVYSLQAFTVSDKAYLLNDLNSRFFIYDPLNTTTPWMESNSLVPYLWYGYILSTSNKGFVMNTGYGELFDYSPEDDSFDKISDFPGMGRCEMSGFVIQDKLYFGFGASVDVDGSCLISNENELWEYTP